MYGIVKNNMLKSWGLGIALGFLLGLITPIVKADYIYEANQDLYDLQTNSSGSTGLGSNDDSVSGAFDLGFTFTFYGNDYTQARMATNGCLHFNLTGSYCGDFTPDPLPQYTNTLFVFWTDLIKDNGSAMKAKAFEDYTIFGWYNMREYNRANSDNSLEVWLYPNHTFEFRYGELDIDSHDVLIGEIGSGSSEVYTYLYHDECNTGTTNSSSCVNTDWNNTSFNTLLENGGSLYGVGVGQSLCITSPLTSVNCAGYAEAYLVQQCALNSLYDEDCDGYAAAYLSQQCGIDQLYSESCPYYWDAYDDFQCDLDPQYGPFCAGYSQQESVAFFDDTNVDYGYEESMTQYDTYEDEFMFEEHFFEPEYDFFEEPEFVFEEEVFVFVEEIIFEQLQPLDEFIDPLPFIREEEVFIPIEDLMIEEFVFQETFIEEMEEWFEEETILEEELAYAEEQEEELIEELVEEEDEVIEEEIEEELVASEEKSSISKEMALSVVSSTLATAQASVSGTTAGTSVHTTGNSIASGNAVSSSSNAGISTSSSPSMSDQFASSTAQTNQVLDMSSMSIADTSISTTNTVEIETVSTEVVVASVSTTSSQDIITSSTNSVNSDSDTDTTVETIIAKNLQTAKEEVQAQQEETGEYGSENAILAVMSFVPGFNAYKTAYIPEKEFWYESKSIYTNTTIQDNTNAFYQLAGTNIRTLNSLKEMQPIL